MLESKQSHFQHFHSLKISDMKVQILEHIIPKGGCIEKYTPPLVEQ